MKPTIEVVEPRLFGGVVADEIVASIGEAISERGSCSVALAGGRSPGVVYRTISKPGRVELIDWKKVRLYLGDERWVAPTDDQSNYRMVCETLLADIPEPRPQLFAVPTELASAAEGAKRYAEILTQQEQSTGGVPIIDLMILGIGEDGHTASLFPGAPELMARGTVCQAVRAPDGKSERVTMSMDVIRAARKILFIVRGEGKAEVLRRVIETTESVQTLPSRVWTENKGRVSFFIESSAAVALSPETRAS